MTASGTSRKRRLQGIVGVLGHPRVWRDDQGRWNYSISCVQCHVTWVRYPHCDTPRWSTRETGHNRYGEAVHKWNQHMITAHPDAPEPESMAIERDYLAKSAVNT